MGFKKLINQKAVVLSALVFLAVGILGVLFFRPAKSLPLADENAGALSINRVVSEKSSPMTLPKGYVLDKYKVEKVLDVSCQSDSACSTPFNYVVQSHCPFVTLCLKGQCTVVCPQHNNI